MYFSLSFKLENYQFNKIHSPKKGKNCSFRTSKLTKIDYTFFSEWWKIKKFPHCPCNSSISSKSFLLIIQQRCSPPSPTAKSHGCRGRGRSGGQGQSKYFLDNSSPLVFPFFMGGMRKGSRRPLWRQVDSRFNVSFLGHRSRRRTKGLQGLARGRGSHFGESISPPGNVWIPYYLVWIGLWW